MIEVDKINEFKNVKNNDISFRLINFSDINSIKNLINDDYFFDDTFDLKNNNDLEIRKFIKQNDLNIEKNKKFFLIVKKNNRKIGMLYINLKKNNDFKVEVYCYIDNKYRNKNIGTNVINEIFNYLFNYKNINKISINILENNIYGINFCKHLNMIKEVVREYKIIYNNKYLDLITFGILKEEFVNE